MRRGCSERSGLEDRAGGWKRVKRARNANRVDYAIVGEAWESDLLSTPDNQNKELVKIYLGPDPVTGEQQYDVHPRRAQLYTNRKSLEKFRCSHFATRLREAAREAVRAASSSASGSLRRRAAHASSGASLQSAIASTIRLSS